MGVESLGGGVGAAVGGVSPGLSSGAEVGSGALATASGGIGGLTSEASGLSAGASSGLFSVSESFGGLDTLGGRAGSLSDFQSVFNFGPEHRASSGIFSVDRAFSAPQTAFNESVFEIAARPQTSVENPLTEVFGPQIGLVESPINDGSVSQPETIFNENFFENLLKVNDAPLSRAEEPAETIAVESSALEELFGPKLDYIKSPMAERPVFPAESIFESSVFETIVRPVADQTKEASDEIEVKVKSDVIEPENATIFFGQAPAFLTEDEEGELKEVRTQLKELQESKTVWQILTEDLAPVPAIEVKPAEAISKEAGGVAVGRVETETETESENKTEIITQTENALFDGQRGGQKLAVEDNQPEDQELKEPLWLVSGKKPGSEVIDKRVLKRRLDVAQGAVETSFEETIGGVGAGNNSFLSRVKTRLLALDIPTEIEAVRIIFGNLRFPFVSGDAEKNLGKLKNYELTPGKVLQAVQKTVGERPPLTHQAGEMEIDGSIPQSKLEGIAKEPAMLAKEGADHIVYDHRKGFWKKVEKKPAKYVWELDKTKKTVPVKPAVDSKNSEWYTLSARRAEARVKQKAKS